MHRIFRLIIREHAFAVAFIAIALGVFLRLDGLNFDAGQHLHPDERFLTMVVGALEWPGSFQEYFDTSHSALNPSNHRGFEYYVYGDLPIFLAKAAADISGTDGYDSFVITGRLLTAFADILVIIMVFLLGRSFLGYYTGLLAAALYSLSVLPVQLSHFFTTDPFLNLFLTLALYFSMKHLARPGISRMVPAGLSWGMALASKISALCFAPVFIASWIIGMKKGQGIRPFWAGCAGLLSALLVFRILHPYAFSGPGFLDTGLNQDFIGNLKLLSSFYRPSSGFPPALQWRLRTPLLFGLENMATWGMGTALFFSALIGAILIMVQCVKKGRTTLLLPLLFTISVTGSLLIQPGQTMRYLLPIYPVMAIFAAHGLLALRARLKEGFFSCWPVVMVILFTLCWALAFASIYCKPMTRIEASHWIYEHIPAGSALAFEYWDDSLPLPLPGTDRQKYSYVCLKPAGPDTIQKADALVNHLAESDYVIISSNRFYASISRLRHVFPIAARYYELLFGNLAGFTMVREFSSYPSLGWLTIPDDGAEEAFTVYDHPRVFIFRKNRQFSKSFLRKEFAAALASMPKPGHGACALQASDPVRPVTDRGLDMAEREEPVFVLRFMAVMVLAGIAGSFLVRHLFPGSGLPARAIALGAGASVYGIFLKYTSLANEYLIVFITGLIAIPAFLYLWMRPAMPKSHDNKWNSLVFWTVFFVFLLIRAHNPAIFWGERPMDFSLLNAMMRTSGYPPVDPWFAGAALKYHGWGQFFVAFTGLVAHIPPEYLYNLGAAVIPALASELYFWAIGKLTGSRAAAILGISLIFLAGNLSAWLLHPWNNGWTFSDFWEASRVIPGTINEFPLWSGLFADLHGHFIGLVFSGILISALVLWSRTSGNARYRASFLAGIALGWIALTNSWAIPVYLLLVILIAMTSHGREAAILIIPSGLVMLAAALPFWSSPANAAVILWAEKGIAVSRLLIVFGPFLLLFLIWIRRSLGMKPAYEVAIAAASAGLLIVFPSGIVILLLLFSACLLSAWRETGNKGIPFIHIFIITGLLVLIICDIFTISDRMNTVFKYYFETWMLFSIAATLVFRRLAAEKQHSWLAVGISTMLLGSMFLTPICAFRAWWDNPKIPASHFTLNGLSFLREREPDSMKLVCWLRRHHGQQTIAEAYGPSYGPYGRISSFTGMPAIIGWEYHVYQHGHPWNEIKKREADTRALYQDPSLVEDVIHRYHVRYGILGRLEKETYGATAGSHWPESGMHPLFRSGQAEVWSGETVY